MTNVLKLNDCIQNTTCRCNQRQNLRQIQSETKSSPRQNSVPERICEKKFFVKKLIVGKKLSRTLSRISSEMSQTNRCLSSLSGIHIPQLSRAKYGLQLVFGMVYELLQIKFKSGKLMYTQICIQTCNFWKF